MALVQPISVAVRFYGRSVAWKAGSNPAEGMDSSSCERCELSCRGFCDGLIIRPEESYRCVCVCVCVCACVCVLSSNLNNKVP